MGSIALGIWKLVPWWLKNWTINTSIWTRASGDGWRNGKRQMSNSTLYLRWISLSYISLSLEIGREKDDLLWFMENGDAFFLFSQCFLLLFYVFSRSFFEAALKREEKAAYFRVNGQCEVLSSFMRERSRLFRGFFCRAFSPASCGFLSLSAVFCRLSVAFCRLSIGFRRIFFLCRIFCRLFLASGWNTDEIWPHSANKTAKWPRREIQTGLKRFREMPQASRSFFI